MSHSVDAVLGGQRNYEFIDLQQRGLHPVEFLPEEHGVPPYDEPDPAGAPRRGGRSPAAAVPGGAGGGDQHRDHPSGRDVAGLHARASRTWDTPLNHAAWFASLPHLARAPALLDRARYAAFERFMVEQGSIKAALPVSAIAIDPTEGKAQAEPETSLP